MTDRLKAVKRLARVQGQVKRLAEAELKFAEDRKRDIEATALGLDAFMGEPDLSARMMSLALGQRRRIAVRQAGADRALSAQADTTLEARSRSRLAERMVEDIATEERRVEERKDLERLIEAAAALGPPSGASLP